VHTASALVCFFNAKVADFSIRELSSIYLKFQCTTDAFLQLPLDLRVRIRTVLCVLRRYRMARNLRERIVRTLVVSEYFQDTDVGTIVGDHAAVERKQTTAQKLRMALITGDTALVRAHFALPPERNEIVWRFTDKVKRVFEDLGRRSTYELVTLCMEIKDPSILPAWTVYCFQSGFSNMPAPLFEQFIQHMRTTRDYLHLTSNPSCSDAKLKRLLIEDVMLPPRYFYDLTYHSPSANVMRSWSAGFLQHPYPFDTSVSLRAAWDEINSAGAWLPSEIR
jgi:hypothetical protein